MLDLLEQFFQVLIIYLPFSITAVFFVVVSLTGRFLQLYLPNLLLTYIFKIFSNHIFIFQEL